LLAAAGPPKPREQRLHSRSRRHLTLRLPPHSVGERKQPAMRLLLFRCLGEHVAKIVLVMATNSPAVGSLSKLKV